MFFEGNNRIYLAGQAFMLDQTRSDVEMASSEWAAKHIIPNEANSYILGRFVEADRANANKQYFKMGDLLFAKPTISYAPLNINHDPRNTVGTFIASEFQYPVNEDENPHIEALAALWKYQFPEAYTVAQNAFAQGALFYSMEAVPRTLSTVGGTDDEAQYAYEGRISPNYPKEINERSCEAVVLNNPHFVGGALIVPPNRPGWHRADIKQLSKFVTDQWETAERIYEGVKDEAPHLDATAWEGLMGTLILMAQMDAKALTTKTRDALPSSAFVFPKTREYPIQDLNHARNALARSAGKPEEGAVRAAVYKKYPQLKK